VWDWEVSFLKSGRFEEGRVVSETGEGNTEDTVPRGMGRRLKMGRRYVFCPYLGCTCSTPSERASIGVSGPIVEHLHRWLEVVKKLHPSSPLIFSSWKGEEMSQLT